MVVLWGGVFLMSEVPLWWCAEVEEGFPYVWGIQGYLAHNPPPPQVVTLIAGVFCLTSNWEEVG